ncbi:membrane-associated lipoprotein involved in thiamine biosynthesis [Clostridium botulinum B str. Osaka05]|uniref:FAD:protein FMN transferase n=1 Tax=Clostridium botulinum B str. Osaka05 TaxID=1407017 RepID=A0A0S6U3Y2_CLOBO|nr:FAD:protein FMN transferase [Clostridium botulinum]GAE01592.1 membrane-associated lipoprotein involved in thiamine biosynthesis [Clostridium botulinum B str. Osaka05]
MMKASVAESLSFAMNTEITYRVFGKNAQQALNSGKAEIMQIENTLSRFIPQSEISKVNKSAGKNCENLSPDTYELLSRAVELSKISQGLFDVTIGPLIDLWDYKYASEAPEKAKIHQVIPLVNYRDLVLNPCKRTAGLQNSGQSIDLGGIGKGFASDRFIEILKKYGITSAFTNIGGNVSTLGNKPDGSPWSVGIRHPREENRLIGAISVTGKAVVTSGDYERYFIDRDGKRCHHILDPTTGYPAESGLISVTIIADSAMIADALSTSVFVAGLEKGLNFLENFPKAEVVIVDSNLRIYMTQGMKDFFQPAKESNIKLL